MREGGHSSLSRAAAAAGRGIARLLPAKRREWVEAVWAEAPEASPGLRRLVWRAGGVRLIASDLLIRRGLMTPLLFAIAGTSIVWEVWPGSSAMRSTGVNRLNALGIVLMLAGLALVSRRFLDRLATAG